MDKKQVLDIVERHAFPGSGKDARLVETHISWVILTPDFAFKIKKPVRFDFLDFSTLPLRKKFCEAEVQLNRRLAPDTYLGVLPVGLKNGEWQIGGELAEPLDYAVWMRREDDSHQLDRLLRAGEVVPNDLQKLAHQLAVFHKKQTLPHPDFDPNSLVEDFADLFHHEKKLVAALGESTAPVLAEMREELPRFIERHSGRLLARANGGFWVDGHGDLHSRNIFLTDPPIVFDCIEFDPHLRHLDVLNELAFLCMDFDFFGRPDLGEALFHFYQLEHACITSPEDEALFLFFKAYRANVRLKVTLLGNHSTAETIAALRGYWDLLRKYWGGLI
ncbi:MAG: phosphotransferase [Saprospiraceae bacterium]|nr:phosphotransferase [Saprospiraceae bacterium]MCF8249591.1 phosphotransferase [Saprospiraceae bacterium]MCF8280491.1 phosphotransferase [Bacteroidales bacterium]MCF8310423.1 phosphotransferase [Saprospiraceae bacterium]MCF8439801.1 phosphotransferase [Saprospiraceae bacterium]